MSQVKEIFSKHWVDHIYNFLINITFKDKKPNVSDFVKEVRYLVEYTKLLHRVEKVAITLERLEKTLKDLEQLEKE